MTTHQPTLHLSPNAVRRHRTRWPLVRHGLEMLLAMAAGMAVLGEARSLLGLDVSFAEHPGGSYALMATDMSVAMAAWMRFRRHGWAPTLEMCAAMYVPLALVPLVRVDAMSPMAFMVSGHVVMVVAMVGVLWRHHRAHPPTEEGAP